MGKRLNILFISLLIGLAYPCSCLEPLSPEEAYEDADVVFSGKVTDMVLDGTGYYYEVTFQTIDVWKGEDSKEITVLTETYSDACGYNFQINNEYLVYAYNYTWGIYTNICTRTNLLEYASEDLDYLNGFNNGDLNGDDSVDILDVVMLVNYILSGDNSELDGADINNDGDVNVLDVVALVNIILGS